MRRIKLDSRDASLFAHDLEDADLDFYYGHKDTFKRMWQDQVCGLFNSVSNLRSNRQLFSRHVK